MGVACNATPVVQFGRHMHPNGNRSLQAVAIMTVIKQDNVEPRKLSKERRKEISARYYQHHHKIIKLAMTLDISMKEARAMHAREAAVKSKNPTLMPFGKSARASIRLRPCRYRTMPSARRQRRGGSLSAAHVLVHVRR
jgi:hypothetical protein